MLFFDIDDTLTDSYHAHRNAIRILFEQQTGSLRNTTQDLEDWLKITDKYLAKYFRKEISLEEQRYARLIDFWELQGHRLTKLEAMDLYPQYHDLYLNNCLLFDDVKVALTKLSSYRLGIISNGVYNDQLYKLKNNAIYDLFTEVIISEDIGFAKPQSEIFTIAVQRSNLSVSDCYYIGNSYTLDYLGAKKAGLNALWINRLDEDHPVPTSQQFKSLSAAINYYLTLQEKRVEEACKHLGSNIPFDSLTL